MELAMDSLKDKYEFAIRWEPFLLRPNTPPEGRPKSEAFRDPNNPYIQRLKKTGAEIGLEFASKSAMIPNTVKSHALLEYAKEKNDGVQQNAVAEKLFKKMFTEGDMLGDDTLLKIASDVGFDTDEVKSYVNDANILAKVVEKAATWSSRGITGVPTFYFNGKQVFSGAQDTETFTKMFDIINEKFPLTTDSKN